MKKTKSGQKPRRAPRDYFVPQVVHDYKQERQPHGKPERVLRGLRVLQIHQHRQNGGGGLDCRVLKRYMRAAIAARAAQVRIRKQGDKIPRSKLLSAVHASGASLRLRKRDRGAPGIVAIKQYVKKAPEYGAERGYCKYNHYGVMS